MIKIRDLSYSYEDGTRALNNINLSGDKGNIIGIIGTNGSGKSTLFLNIMGILKPQEGQVLYEGRPIKYSKSSLREYRKDVNIVFQNPDQQLFYSNTYDDIAFALRNLGLQEDFVRARVERALERVDGMDLLEKPTHFLSFGQKKKVALAGLLALETRLLLLDEPTAGLDPFMVKQVKRIINDIGQKQKIIISSHDMDLIYDICDYIYVLDQGSILGQGDPQSIFSQEGLLDQARLTKPWLMRIYEKFQTRYFKNEDDFNSYERGD